MESVSSSPWASVGGNEWIPHTAQLRGKILTEYLSSNQLDPIVTGTTGTQQCKGREGRGRGTHLVAAGDLMGESIDPLTP